MTIEDWRATFTELREAGVTLQEWLTFHKNRRALLTPLERDEENA